MREMLDAIENFFRAQIYFYEYFSSLIYEP